SLGVGDASETFEESLAGIDGDQVQPQLLAHRLLDSFVLVLAQHAIVDEDARQAMAQRPISQHGRYRGIDTSTERADRMSVRGHFRLNPLYRFFGETPRCPVALQRGDIE